MGTKSIAMVQFAPDASVCKLLEELSCGQVEDESNAKFAAILGLLPLEGGGIVRLALPILETVAVCGSSVASDVPTVVAVGYINCDWLISTLRMRLLPKSAM